MKEITRDTLQERLDQLPEEFEKIQKEILVIEEKEAQLVRQKSGCNMELLRLQGENRLLKDLLKEEPAEETAV